MSGEMKTSVAKPSPRRRRIMMIRKVKGPAHGRDFDREFWRRMGAQARWAETWEMTVRAHGLRTDSQRRLQRNIAGFRQEPG